MNDWMGYFALKFLFLILVYLMTIFVLDWFLKWHIFDIFYLFRYILCFVLAGNRYLVTCCCYLCCCLPCLPFKNHHTFCRCTFLLLYVYAISFVFISLPLSEKEKKIQRNRMHAFNISSSWSIRSKLWIYENINVKCMQM